MCVSMKQSQLENTGLCCHTVVSKRVGEDIAFNWEECQIQPGLWLPLYLGLRCQGTLSGVLQWMQFGLGSKKMHPGWSVCMRVNCRVSPEQAGGKARVE